MRSHLSPLRILFLFALLAGCAATAPRQADAPAASAPRLVLCLRHAEKASGNDPVLTPDGEARAATLSRLLAAAEVTQLYASPFRRTRQTLEPLAAATGLTVETYDAADLPALVDELDRLPPGSFAVVAGHSNTTPALVRALGGDLDGTVDSAYGELIDEDAHDRAFLVVRAGAGAPARTVELQYGTDG